MIWIIINLALLILGIICFFVAYKWYNDEEGLTITVLGLIFFVVDIISEPLRRWLG